MYAGYLRIADLCHGLLSVSPETRFVFLGNLHIFRSDSRGCTFMLLGSGSLPRNEQVDPSAVFGKESVIFCIDNRVGIGLFFPTGIFFKYFEPADSEKK